jgi:hypothetical protein
VLAGAAQHGVRPLFGMRTWPSVTEIECSCGYLERAASNPNTPIRYDPEFNEYSIISFLGASRSDIYVSSLIYHCPFCGGAAPESTRGRSFATLPNEELHRLRTLVHGIQSVDDALRILGPPTSDEAIQMPPGYVYPTQRSDKPCQPVRALSFASLSDVADIEVCVNDDDTVEVTIGPKYIGLPKNGV